MEAEFHAKMTLLLWGIMAATAIICGIMAWKAIDDCRKARERRKRRKEQRDAKYQLGLAALEQRDFSTVETSGGYAWSADNPDRRHLPSAPRKRQGNAEATG